MYASIYVYEKTAPMSYNLETAIKLGIIRIMGSTIKLLDKKNYELEIRILEE